MRKVPSPAKGKNVSFTPAMISEVAAVSQKHGVTFSEIVQACIRLGLVQVDAQLTNPPQAENSEEKEGE